MFKHSFSSKNRAKKRTKPSKKNLDEEAKERMEESMDNELARSAASPLTSPIVNIIVGKDKRTFAAHEDVLTVSPLFYDYLRDQSPESGTKQLDLPEEEPEIFSCILEFLYKGDYYPRMFRSKRSGNWCLENAQEDSETGGNGSSEPTFLHPGVGDVVLRDSVVYCAAGKYGLERLKRLALRKQGLQTGISADVLLRSARYTYENTPPTDDGLRVYYLAHIIRNRRALKQSTTMHTEMQKGGTLFFDLFVAMCNAMDDTVEIRPKRSYGLF
ncbi:hypothetical protein PDE_05075 [Penicillium oxalicum 114-2]|uniref:BTB domain-containing protein n=1 Tax=Penicillium oxalicum (strain 114-2 / CGMCC 5302) TaxID=933388 RepID=S7ZHI2_PENO1|nr:hypothetical protein PDE_05075 [Penicillium oxalicum 114-2]